ncbi:Fasciclin-like arabinogalactan protein [Psilocybe cubensis]|uniref:Fasciclin-like arabinogalactan protein n=2 Tax=Psilocybe cubensis TaxID=181762 RepID=A0ACB8GZ32_PSICU|nr:Fasciclin-like arabinogalactan protein [Psilocybe cubensis]KAH9480841.1 Fasciclin-like arabinogalactan protein [Psilocybe cubensis]
MHISLAVPILLGVSVSAQSIIDAVGGQAQLSMLALLLNAQPGLVSTLSSAQNITLLAPHNDAFNQFLSTPGGMQASAQLDVVAALLEYHVINGAFHSSSFTSTPVFPNTFLTNTTYTGVTGGQVVEVVAQNGAVNVFSGLKSKSTVTTPDLQFNGGFIHVIDTVLTIPPNISTTAMASNLSQLASAVTSAGLLSAVDSTPNITVFAPTDAAFAAIADTVKGLTTNQLASILEYHVVPALGYSSALKTGNLPTLEGQQVNVVVDGGSVKVNNANVVMADVIVGNGVVHVIDTVLSLPGGNNTGSSTGPTIGSNGSSPSMAGPSSGTNSSPNSSANATMGSAGFVDFKFTVVQNPPSNKDKLLKLSYAAATQFS